LGQEKFAGKLAASLPRKRKNQTESYEANYTETEEAKLQRNGRTEEGLGGARFGAQGLARQDRQRAEESGWENGSHR
jgi:hypothetical protein